jgi:hypothetical protein
MKRALFIMLIFGAAAVTAQEQDISKHPGFIDLSEIKIPGYSAKITDISLGPALLKVAADLEEGGGEELGKTLESLKSIQVKGFEYRKEDAERIRDLVKKFDKKIKSENWESLINIRSGEDIVNISLKYDKGKMAGLFLMAIDSGEVQFVNMVGSLSLAEIMKVTSQLSEESGALDSLKALSKDKK